MVGHAQDVPPFKESIVVEATGFVLPPSAGSDIQHQAADQFFYIDPGCIPLTSPRMLIILSRISGSIARNRVSQMMMGILHI